MVTRNTVKAATYINTILRDPTLASHLEEGALITAMKIDVKSPTITMAELPCREIIFLDPGAGNFFKVFSVGVKGNSDLGVLLPANA